MTLIGFGHRKLTGKSTCCQILADEFGYERFAYTTPLREALRAINPIVTKDPTTGRAIRWAEMEERLGYDQAKAQCPEFRAVMIRTGDGLRGILGDHIWLDSVMAAAAAVPRACIENVRYPAEAAAVRAAGGFLVEVIRPDVPDTPDAADEKLAEFDGWDLTIVNDGTVDDLRAQLSDVLSLRSVRRAG